MRVVVNVAASADGKLATRQREQLRISGPEDRDRVDELRAEVDAILVGSGTVLADDPSLVVAADERVAEREADGRPAQPTRVVLDSRARIPADARVLDDRARTVIVVAESAAQSDVDALEAANAEVVRTDGERVDVTDAVAALDERGIDRLLVEGGGEVIFSFVAAGLVDRLSVYLGSLLVGGRDAPTLVDGEGFVEDLPRLVLQGIERLDDGVLLRYDGPGQWE